SGKVSVVLGPAEDDEYTYWAAHAAVARGLGLGQLAALLSMADVYIGNDSGVTHLAAAGGVKTIALFGPTDPVEWAPRGSNVEIITLQVECSPCERPAMKSCRHRKCLTALKPGDVITSCKEFRLKNPVLPLLDKGVGRH
ncbi:MAG TPA: glycosyltransferase family 9 protein, partial [Candidatus Binatia bacterium]